MGLKYFAPGMCRRTLAQFGIHRADGSRQPIDGLGNLAAFAEGWLPDGGLSLRFQFSLLDEQRDQNRQDRSHHQGHRRQYYFCAQFHIRGVAISLIPMSAGPACRTDQNSLNSPSNGMSLRRPLANEADEGLADVGWLPFAEDERLNGAGKPLVTLR